ncbi:MAG: nucleotidyltransferase family protein [Metallosphaera sp.]|uniref:nucleotidyltransferase family protein n=1 Tax=Metallosphaera sp. TaxID=2020860 RepID=UPI003164D0FD
MIGVIVLAAGEGSRFGKNKLLADLKGKPVLRWVLESLPNQRVIVAGRYAKEIIQSFPDEVIVYNPWWRDGISSSLKLGLKFFTNTEGILVALGDMPLITKETVRRIINGFSQGCPAVVPVHDGQWGNPVLISNKLYSKIRDIKGDVGAKVILKQTEGVCFVECGNEILIDVDTEADLVEVSRLLP